MDHENIMPNRIRQKMINIILSYLYVEQKKQKHQGQGYREQIITCLRQEGGPNRGSKDKFLLLKS